MKRITKPLLAAFIFSLLCLLGLSVQSQAASNTPGQVKKLTATAQESAIILSWNKVSNADAYRIYSVNPATNAATYLTIVDKTSIKIKNLKNGTPYTYSVCAVRIVKNRKYEGKKSTPVTATPMVDKPAVPKLQVKACGEKRVTLTWNKIGGATYYELFQKNKAKKYVSIGTTKKTSVTVKNLTNGTAYQFKLKAVRKVGGVKRSSNLSTYVVAKPIHITNEISNITSMRFKARVNRTVKAELIGSPKKYVTVKSGTNVTVLNKTTGNCSVKLSSGKKVYIPAYCLSIYGQSYYSRTDYTTEAKEGFVNYKGYSSPSRYLIWISLYRQHLYIFKGSQCNWKLYKTFLCSSGRYPINTPKGVYRLRRKAPRAYSGLSYFDYVSYFSGNAIHGWVWVIGTGWDPAGSLGNPASHGCVRLSNTNAKYIYTKIPMQTTIVIY